PMLNLRSLELDRERIAMGREPVDDRASRIAEPQKLRHFIECFSGSVVARVPYIAVGPEIFVHLGKIEMRMPTRNNQRQHRKMQLAIFALPLLKQHRMDVSFKMVNRDQRLFQRKRQSFGKADADQ